jgi:hypothetical protein
MAADSGLLPPSPFVLHVCVESRASEPKPDGLRHSDSFWAKRRQKELRSQNRISLILNVPCGSQLMMFDIIRQEVLDESKWAVTKDGLAQYVEVWKYSVVRSPSNSRTYYA